MTLTLWEKKKKHTWFYESVDAQKTLNKIQHIVMIKALSKRAV